MEIKFTNNTTKPVYSTRYHYSSHWDTSFPEERFVGYDTYYICPNVKEHDQIIERRREQQREQEINDLRERIRNLEQK